MGSAKYGFNPIGQILVTSILVRSSYKSSHIPYKHTLFFKDEGWMV